MNSFLTFFNGERLFGFVVYNLVIVGLMAFYLFIQVAVMGNEIVWAGPQVYSYDDKLPTKRSK